MKKKLINLSEKVETFYIDVFELINKSTSKLYIPFFVVGATARDFILKYGFNIKQQRMTYDIDLAIRVPSWNEFDSLVNHLSEHKDIKKTNTIHRLIFKDSLPIDIVPFGLIADSENKISWPPENAFVFNTLGYEEAFNNAISIILKNEPKLQIKVIDLKCLTLLKLISYSDRSALGEFRDASDLAYLFDNYLYAGNEESLFNEYNDLLEEDGFDYNTAGSRILGRDISKIISSETKNNLLEILDKEIESEVSNLIAHMVDSLDDGTEYQKKLKQIEALKKGLLE